MLVVTPSCWTIRTCMYTHAEKSHTQTALTSQTSASAHHHDIHTLCQGCEKLKPWANVESEHTTSLYCVMHAHSLIPLLITFVYKLTRTTDCSKKRGGVKNTGWVGCWRVTVVGRPPLSWCTAHDGDGWTPIYWPKPYKVRPWRLRA